MPPFGSYLSFPVFHAPSLSLEHETLYLSFQTHEPGEKRIFLLFILSRYMAFGVRTRFQYGLEALFPSLLYDLWAYTLKMFSFVSA